MKEKTKKILEKLWSWFFGGFMTLVILCAIIAGFVYWFIEKYGHMTM